MKKSIRTLTRSALLAGVVGVIASAGVTLADPPIIVGACDRGGFCPDVYAPVICSNGRVYANSCYAWKACATGCVPYADVR